MADPVPTSEIFDLESVLAALCRDYKKLVPRIRELSHGHSCNCSGIKLRLHYPAIRQGKATVFELVEAIFLFITSFSLPRSQTQKLYEQYGSIDPDEYEALCISALEKAKNLFKLAHKATNRNGEAGELLLYVLTEWILEAPQIIAKMSLKTNSQMPVHGSDGVHTKYCNLRKKLLFFWGESKLYGDSAKAIKEAVESIATSLQPDKVTHELELVQRNIDFSGLDQTAKQELLAYLDPYDEKYNQRHDVITCLIAFDFSKYSNLSSSDDETHFSKMADDELRQLSPRLEKALKKHGLEDQEIEVFLFPIPSVQIFRDLFQQKIGWHQ